MTVDELRSLPPGTRLIYVFGDGEGDRHPAKVLDHGLGWTGIHILFTNKPKQRVRWSMRTNRPVGTKGHVGSVRLELADRPAE